MRKSEADRLRDIADFLDEYFLEIYKINHKYGYIVHWTAQEIRKVIFNDNKRAYKED